MAIPSDKVRRTIVANINEVLSRQADRKAEKRARIARILQYNAKRK
jgi:hypothetical protein